jgi:CheY-like chemotaxis protein
LPGGAAVFAEGLPLSVGEIGDELIKKLRGTGRASAGTGYAAQLAGSKTPGADFANGRQRGQPDVAVRLLEKRGYLVSVAVNGREAVEAVQRDEFAVILMDIQMPEMDGFEVTTAMRKKERGTPPRTPIVAMTARARKGDEDHVWSAGWIPISRSRFAARNSTNCWKAAGFSRREGQHRGRHAGANVSGGRGSGLNQAERFVGGAELWRVFIEDDGDGNILQQLFEVPFVAE